jgi:hypothetical protein
VKKGANEGHENISLSRVLGGHFCVKKGEMKVI